MAIRTATDSLNAAGCSQRSTANTAVSSKGLPGTSRHVMSVDAGPAAAKRCVRRSNWGASGAPPAQGGQRFQPSTSLMIASRSCSLIGQKLWHIMQYAWISRSSSSSLTSAARLNPCCGCERPHTGQIATNRIDSCRGSSVRIQRARCIRVSGTDTCSPIQGVTCRLRQDRRASCGRPLGETPNRTTVGYPITPREMRARSRSLIRSDVTRS
jgi:hypothetical protein